MRAIINPTWCKRYYIVPSSLARPFSTALKRHELLQRLNDTKEEFDVLVIGGGSTGAGVALDAASRGLKTICLEREDFGSGTSSRSTKLIWGGSRYLVQALISLFSLNVLRQPSSTVTKFVADFKMVLNCHRERKFLLNLQPHLASWLPIAVPLKQWIMWPPPFGYYPAALGPLGLFPVFFKFYDSLSWFSSPPSHVMTPARARRKFPQLNNEAIKYCSVFYEGIHDDARTNLAIALTAAEHGAAVLNYCDVTRLLKDEASGRVTGAVMVDQLTGVSYTVRARGVLICGGPFTDSLRRMEALKPSEPFKPAVTGSSGIHVVLPGYFAPPSFGLVDMSTSDGRFLFLLPWQGHVLVGTTDRKVEASEEEDEEELTLGKAADSASGVKESLRRPVPRESEIRWLLNEASKYLSPELRLQRRHVLSAWSGVRPLAVDPHHRGEEGGSTASASRDHVVSFNPHTGVVFVAGGKWTTYREMAEDAVDKLLSAAPGLSGKTFPRSSTLQIELVGKTGFSVNLAAVLMQEFSSGGGGGISYATATHLVKAYGGRAREVLQTQPATHSGAAASDALPSAHSLLVPGYPYIEAEVIYAVRRELAVRAEDVIARRTRLAFLDRDAALLATPQVVRLMAAELGWWVERAALETQRCVRFLQSFGGPVPNRSSEENSARIATEADVQSVFKRLETNGGGGGHLDPALVGLLGEMLHYTLSPAEIQDCVDFCARPVSGGKNAAAAIRWEDFHKWWNSDRLNPHLAHVKSTAALGSASKVEGSGIFFG